MLSIDYIAARAELRLAAEGFPMSMVCPQCSQVYEQQERICPACSVQLLFYAQMAPASAASPLREESNGRWQHTALGRVAVGIILAQGLALGLKHLMTAGLLAGGEDTAVELWGSVTGLILLHSLHALGLFVGGALAGAGQDRGAFLGALTGLGSGMIFLALMPATTQLLPDGSYYAQPLVHLLFGAIGGWVGRTIWKPIPVFVVPQFKPTTPPPALFEVRWLSGPIAWGRVIAGATLMACGMVWSNMILNWMVDASRGTLALTTHFQAKLISAEIAGLTMLVGAAFAGATTWNGAKQGLCVGVGGAVLYLGFQWANPTILLETAVFAVSCTIGLGLVGGWFGGQLFPPLGERRHGRRIIDL